MHTTYYQYFVGRDSRASIVSHRSQVFVRMGELKWETLRLLDIQWVYLLGIFDTRGPIVVEKERGVSLASKTLRVPSLFAITDHTRTHPDLGTLDEFRLLVKTLHDYGFKVMVDFVANHTSSVHPWIQSNPEFYARNDQGLIHEFSGDVVKLSYDEPLLRTQMVQVARTIAAWGVDGLRCDMAHLMPLDFWETLIEQLRIENNQFHFMAEAYTSSVFDWKPLEDLLNSGFDAVYEEKLYRDFNSYFLNSISLNDVVKSIHYFCQRTDKSKYVHYLMNHDDAMGSDQAEYIHGLTLLLKLIGHKTLLFNGQLKGRVERLAHHWPEMMPDSLYEVGSEVPWYQEFCELQATYAWQVTEAKIQGNSLLQVKLRSQVNADAMMWLNLGSYPVQLTLAADEIIYCTSLHNGCLEVGGVAMCRTGK